MTKKNTKGTKLFGDIFCWIFIIGIFAGIWIPQYRWRLIFTSLFCLFLALIIASYLKDKKEGK